MQSQTKITFKVKKIDRKKNSRRMKLKSELII